MPDDPFTLRQIDRIRTLTGFVRIGHVAELDAAGQFSRWVGNHDILVFRRDGAIRALSNICPHFGGPVGFYEMRSGRFTCLWHNLQYDADTGQCVSFPKLKLREYKIKVEDGDIYAQLIEEQIEAVHTD
jgi:nitrite reductase/ring-hydroxylating ferredoxin subunit